MKRPLTTISLENFEKKAKLTPKCFSNHVLQAACTLTSKSLKAKTKGSEELNVESDDGSETFDLPQMTNSSEPCGDNEPNSPLKENRIKPIQHISTERSSGFPATVPFLGNASGGRSVSVAIPASIASNAQSFELRAYLVGQIARTLTIFGVDEIIVYEDSSSDVNQGSPFNMKEFTVCVEETSTSIENNTALRTDCSFDESTMQNNTAASEVNHRYSKSRSPSQSVNQRNTDENVKQKNDKTDQHKEDVSDDDDSCESNDESDLPKQFINDQKWSQSLQFFVRNLSYLETPQYLRKALFKMHPSLRMAGLQNPLDSPHHMRANEWLPYREGYVTQQQRSKNCSLIDCGLSLPVQVPGLYQNNSRVTVRLDSSSRNLCPDFSNRRKHFKKLNRRGSKNSNECLQGKVVPRREPINLHGVYWGYHVRCCYSLRDVLKGCPFSEDGNYDLLIGTSEKGDEIDASTFQLKHPHFKHCLIVFGGLGGLEEVIEDEQSQIEMTDPKNLFDHYLNREAGIIPDSLIDEAVSGCCHGELDILYQTIQEGDQITKTKTELLLCCGDFQAVRSELDLPSLTCPLKYRQLGDFEKYYNGLRTAPILTIFIGGNHEASNVLRELYYGGWVAPNIFYLGQSGVVRIGYSNDSTIRIGGISGIYKGYDYQKGYFELPPYSDETLRTSYHMRRFEVEKLRKISGPLDVFLTHDWPRGVERYGNLAQLLRAKPFFKNEVTTNTLGNPATQQFLYELKPHFWFAGHLHVKFAALVSHTDGTETNDVCLSFGRFLALDKPISRRHFLHFLEIPCYQEICTTGEKTNFLLPRVFYDLDWLAILKENDAKIPVGKHKFTDNVSAPNNFTRQFIQTKSFEMGVLEWKQVADFTLADQRKKFLEIIGITSDSYFQKLFNYVRSQAAQHCDNREQTPIMPKTRPYLHLTQASFDLNASEEIDIDLDIHSASEDECAQQLVSTKIAPESLPPSAFAQTAPSDNKDFSSFATIRHSGNNSNFENEELDIDL